MENTRRFDYIPWNGELGDFYVDQTTGEVIEHSKYAYVNLKNMRGKPIVRCADSGRVRNEMSRPIYGKSVKVIFSLGEDDFPYLDDDELNDILFLSSFIGRDEKLVYTNGKRISWSNIGDMLRFDQQKTSRIKNAAERNGYIVEKEDGSLSLNPRFIVRGGLNKAIIEDMVNQNKSYISLFVSAARSLYRGSGRIKPENILAIIYKLLKYVNVEYNVLCWNPYENDPIYIEPLGVSDVARIVGCTKEYVENTLFRCGFRNDGNEDLLFSRVANIETHVYRPSIHINPYVVYGGELSNRKKVYSAFKSWD